MIVPFQDHAHNGVLHNGFGIEVVGADYNHFKAGLYRSWLVDPQSIVVELPTTRSGFMTDYASYQKERTRIGGHSDTYELARRVVLNRILRERARKTYKIKLKFPSDYDLTNVVFTPGNSPFGEIIPQITPTIIKYPVSETMTMQGVEVDLAYRVTCIEEEPRRAVAVANDKNPYADSLTAALHGMNFFDSNP